MYLPGLEHPADAVPRARARSARWSTSWCRGSTAGRGRRVQLVRIVRAVRGQVRGRHPLRSPPSTTAGPAPRSTSSRARGPSSPRRRASWCCTVSTGAAAGRGRRPPWRDPVLAEGETLALSLSRQGSTRPLDLVEAEDLLATTLAYWQRWIRKSRYRGRYREMVERSALALKLLVHQPTGALVAAADHLAARVDRRHPQLGLPLHLGPRRGLHRLRADAAGLHRGGGRLHGLARGALHRDAPAGPGCRSSTASTAARSPPRRAWTTCGATGTPGRCGSATAPRTSCSWTSTAS